MDIKALAEKYNDYIIEERRYFHQHPELSFEEVETTKTLKTRLEAMGIPCVTFDDYYGLIGTIKGGKPGKTVMLRADIDGLPVKEKTGLGFCSTNSNMHACGHDCHMAMLLGAAKILTGIKDELPGEVKLMFQAAEESCYGSKYYVEKGVLKGIDAIFGMHIWNNLDAGKFSLESGDRMASCDNFTIKIAGTSAHGSAPHLGRDAIVAAASVIMNLQTFASRNNNPLNTLVVTIGTIQGGQRFNIIANEVVMEGTVRTYSRELRKTIEADLRRIICGTAELDYRMILTPIINEHEDLNTLARNAAVKLYGEESIGHLDKVTGSEDFALFMDVVPGFYGFIGGRNPEVGAIHPNHNDRFDIDENVLQRGAALYAQFAVDFLNRK